jgi:pimeloyl-ACP methyl ester carboxylesterase
MTYKQTLVLALSLTCGWIESAAAQNAAKGSPSDDPGGKATIVLVHGAFADSSSWDGVISILTAKGFHVVAASNPLRGLAIDARQVDDLVKTLPGKVVLVGHSYGGQVITAADPSRLKALVYVDGLAPDTGESAADIGDRFPGATLGPTLAPPVPLSDGGKDLYIKQELLPAQFAADVPLAKAKLMAVEQRPVTEAALHDKLQGKPAWRQVPSYSVYGSLDKNITPAALAFMAKRAASRKTIAVPGGSHVVMVSHPEEVADLIITAAQANP